MEALIAEVHSVIPWIGLIIVVKLIILIIYTSSPRGGSKQS